MSNPVGPPVNSGSSVLARDLTALVGGVLWCLALIALAMFVALRSTSAGALLTATQNARGDPEALSGVLARYDDPFGLVTETLPRLMNVLGFGVSLLVGAFVGAVAQRRVAWVSVLSVSPLIASRLIGQPAAVNSWLLACGWMLVSWITAALVSRRRSSPPPTQ
jgi:hypothetical protein